MITIQTEPSVTIVTIIGRIDAISCSEIEQTLRTLTEKENYLILDLSKCPYLSSAGIRTLLITEKVVKSKGGGLLLSGLKPEVFQILEMSGMLQIFHEFSSTEEARGEIVRLSLLSGGSRKWISETIPFEFHPIENQREAALLWKSQGIAGYNELGFSVGTGSPAETLEEDLQTQGVFITTGSCAGFIPANSTLPTEFRIARNPAEAGIFVTNALSFGNQPVGQVLVTDPVSITLGQLSDAIYPLKEQLTSGNENLMALVVANFNDNKPSLSIILIIDQTLNNVLKQFEFGGLCRIIPVGDQEIRLLGARFVLSHIQNNTADISLSKFLEKTLTFENIISAGIIHAEDLLENPITWLFISDGLADSSTMRLVIETGDDLPPEPHKAFLTRRLFTDSARLEIKQIHGGYSAQTFQVTSFDKEGRKLRPTILKIADRAMISRESDRCQRYANQYILNNSAMVLGTAFFCGLGALRYNFVGIGGEQSQLKWLTHYFNTWTTKHLEPLFDKIFLQILKPWYGQPIPGKIFPYRDHDPTLTFFPKLCETAKEQLSVSPDEQFFTVKETRQKLPNPYWFLKHEFGGRRETSFNYYTAICHGDLNMQNILLDEDMNVYLIDFSETRPRSVVSDFARLEAIFMIEHAPLATDQESDEYIRFISRFYNSVRLDFPPVNDYEGEQSEIVNRNVSLTLKMREYAFNGVKGHPNPVPYCLALLEWILPVVCYSSTPIAHKRLSMIVAGLLCKKIIDAS